MEGWVLRADFKNRHFARNGGLPFYGQIPEVGILPVTEHQMATGQPTHCIFQHVFPGCAASLLIGIIFSAGFFGENDSKEPRVKKCLCFERKRLSCADRPPAQRNLKTSGAVRQAFLSVFHGNCQPKV